MKLDFWAEAGALADGAPRAGRELHRRFERTADLEANPGGVEQRHDDGGVRAVQRATARP
jgi:hypothetical protein